MGDWDDEEIVKKVVGASAPAAGGAATGNWDDSDDGDNVKANWDDSSDEEGGEKGPDGNPTAIIKGGRLGQPKKKKLGGITAKEKLEAKKAKRAGPSAAGDFDDLDVGPVSTEEKAKRQAKVLDADLDNVYDMVGVARATDSLDTMALRSAEDFAKFQNLLRNRLMLAEDSPHFGTFVENVVRDLIASMEVDEVKKVAAVVTVSINEKQKAAKTNNKKKKGKGAPTLKMERRAQDLNADALGDDNSEDDDDVPAVSTTTKGKTIGGGRGNDLDDFM